MNISRITLRTGIVLGAVVTLFFFQFSTVSHSQRRVDISIGKPSIWTLAQAHYLLAQMHKTNRGWQVADLGELNPNGINRQRIEVLQTLLGITAEFDAGANFKNRLLQQRYETNYGRQQTVKAEIDRRNNDLIQANRDLFNIGVDLARLKSADPPDKNAVESKTSEQAAKTVERDSIRDRITALNTELTSLVTENISNNLPALTSPFGGGAQPSPSPLAPNLSKLIDQQFLQNLYKDTANKSSQLQASIQLDNYIQMQYEVISKQLTLLRDEVGSGKRVVFLELPASIYSVPKESNDFIAQVRWQVTRYCRRTPNEPTELDNQTPQAQVDDLAQNRDRDTESLARQLRLTTEAPPAPQTRPDGNCFQDLGEADVRTVDIIPRQSALNVNQIHNTSNGFALSARFMAVFGFGGKVDYQRQREVYDQFVYQDIFASGFGKGSNLFGWTFGPLPGTKSLAPGVRTTYAVLVVPADAEKIEIAAKGYAFRRGADQLPVRDPIQTCTGNDICETFRLDIPDDSTNGFFIDRAYYAPVHSGKRVTLVLGGMYFSPQVGILINGVPLERRVSISPIDAPTPVPSQPNTTSSGLVGEYEYVNSRRLVASFTMGDGYEGTPVIALITPEKSSVVNRFRLRINGVPGTSLEREGLLNPMFFSPLAIARIQVLNRETDRATGTRYVRAVISGKGFRPNALISVNGVMIDRTPFTLNNQMVWPIEQKSTHQYNILFRDPMVPSWDITIRQNTTQGQEESSRALTRPFAPRVTYDILRYTPAQRRRAATMDLRISGPDLLRVVGVSVLNDGAFSASSACTGPSATPPTGRLPITCSVISSGEVIVTVNLRPGRSDSLLLLVTADSGESAMLNILPPIAPTISTIVNEVTKKAEGPIEGGYPVTIRGNYLEQVERVFFGNRMAPIQQAGPGVITVVVPKGEEGPVRVLLETNTPYQNKFLSNSQDFADPKETKGIFTYVKPK